MSLSRLCIVSLLLAPGLACTVEGLPPDVDAASVADAVLLDLPEGTAIDACVDGPVDAPLSALDERPLDQGPAMQLDTSTAPADAPGKRDVGSESKFDTASAKDVAIDAACTAGDGGSCDEECVPEIDVLRCKDKTPQTCQADGTWRSQADCPYLCLDGACAGVCAPGKANCDGTTPKTCDSTGQWVTSPIAAGTCNAECTPGADTTRCSGKTPETCGVDGTWKSQADCPNLCAGGSCTGVCSAGETDCSDGRRRACSDSGAWVVSPVVAGTCGAVCTPGTSSPQCSKDTRQICDSNGQWKDDVKCEHACLGAGQCTNCKPGEARCTGSAANLYGTCRSDGSGFSDGQLKVGQCGVKCLPSDPPSCSGNVPQTCNSNGTGWTPGSITTGQCGCTCLPSEPISVAPCSGTTPQVCKSDCTARVAGPITAGICGAECTPGNPMPTASCGQCDGSTTCQVSGMWGACNDPPMHTYYRDADGDGYGSPTVTLNACTQPGGYVTNNSDCCDADGNARPGQTAFFTAKNGCGSWDYNCDNVGEPQPSNTCCFCDSCSSKRTGQCSPAASCGASLTVETTCSGGSYCDCMYANQGGRSVTQACR
jgi:hypothetical protein